MASIHDFGQNNNQNNQNNTGNGSNAGGGGQIAPGQVPPSLDDQMQGSDNLLVNYNEKAKNQEFSEALFRDSQIYQTLSILNTKNTPNALLTGDAGVGKTQIVEEIARRLVAGDPIVNGTLGDKVIYELPLGKIVSGSSLVGQTEQKLYDVLDFVKDPENKAILFIDEIHQIMGSESNPTYNKIAQILKPELGRGGLRTIGATTTQEATSIMSDPAFSRRWSTVQVPELTQEQTSEVILNVRNSFQNHHDVLLPDDLISDVITIGDAYKQYGSHRPASSITLIDKAMADTRIKRLKLIEAAKSDPALNHVIKAQPKPILKAAQLKQSALKLLTGDEKLFEQNADQLEQTLNEQIIGQDKAKTDIIDAVKRLGLRLSDRNKPTSFLFAGPSGTGKTEIAKQVAESVFGSQERMIYLNMSEFSSSSSMTRITGSSAGYVGSDSKEELPFDTLENNPYQLVVLDEFEKASTEVQRFFMQALDEGTVKTNRNKEIDFSRTMIIATTNAGVVDLSKNTLGFTGSNDNSDLANDDIIKALRGSFDTELLNRFENVTVFNNINREDYTKILAVKYNNLIETAQNNRKDLAFTPDYIDPDEALSNPVLKQLAEESFTPLSNGRPAERAVQKHIEDSVLANPNATHLSIL